MMRRLSFKLALALCVGLLLLAAGCGGGGGADNDPDPTVGLTGFTYSPAGPIHVGDEITFTATLNKPSYCYVLVRLPDGRNLPVILGDSGPTVDPVDNVANDGIYHGKLTWIATCGTGTDLVLSAVLLWPGDLTGLTRAATPLTVLP